MFPLVSGQHAGTIEGHVTLVTLERLLSAVQAFVDFQAACLGEASFAYITFVRLFTGVNFLVSDEHGFGWE